MVLVGEKRQLDAHAHRLNATNRGKPTKETEVTDVMTITTDTECVTTLW